MTDKVQKIREEVVRMHNLLPIMDGDNISVNYADRICTTLEMYIDSLQKEPVTVWHDASEEPKPNMELICVGQYGNPLVLSSNSNSFKERYISNWAYFNDLLNLSDVQRTVKNWKEPVSEELEEAIGQSFIYHENRGDDFRSDKQIETAYRYGFETGANWQKEQMMKDAVEAKVYNKAYPTEFEIETNTFMQKLKHGDNVKLIIIKED